MRSLRLPRCALVAAALAVTTARATLADAQPADLAQSPDARAASRKFAEGEQAFRSGDVQRAAQAFEAAYALAPHEDPLWNAARAWHRAGELGRAANLYAKYLREAPASAPDRNSATANLVQLSSKLGRLDIHTGNVEDVRIDDRPVEGASVYVHPGRHILTARRGDQRLEETQTVRAGEVVSVVLGSSAPAPARPAPVEAPPAGEAASLAPRQATPREHSEAARASGGWSPVVVWLGAGLTLGAAAVTTWSGLDTLSERDAFVASPSQAELDRGRDKQTRTNVALGVALGFAALTGLTAIFLVDWRSSGARGQIGLGPGSISARGSF